jgi:hypothetical protein
LTVIFRDLENPYVQLLAAGITLRAAISEAQKPSTAQASHGSTPVVSRLLALTAV